MQLTDAQFDLIKGQFKNLKDRSPFYAKKFEGIDLGDIKTQADFEKLPFTDSLSFWDETREPSPVSLSVRFSLFR